MLKIEPIPALSDNYIWLLYQPEKLWAAVVDPGEEEPVFAVLRERGLALSALLLTHHHGDHTGGVEALVQRGGVQVFGPRDARIPGITRTVREGEVYRLPGLETNFRVMEVPGHTATHVAYQIGDGLFCGDTLFGAGCGRVFDGTFAQLAQSLARIAALSPETRLYCAHEYTLDNLGFATWVEPENPAIAARLADTQRLRAAQQPSVPSRLAEELATNPFLRTQVPAVRAAAERFAGKPLSDPTEVFTALRRWKDTHYDS